MIILYEDVTLILPVRPSSGGVRMTYISHPLVGSQVARWLGPNGDSRTVINHHRQAKVPNFRTWTMRDEIA